jgi:hypothetical protein
MRRGPASVSFFLLRGRSFLGPNQCITSLSSPCAQPAIDHQAMTGHITGSVGGEID